MSLRAAIDAFRGRFSLAARLLVIISAVLLVDFAMNSFQFERASTLALGSEEAARMADHLVVARRVIGNAPAADRPALSRTLSTERFQLAWRGQRNVAASARGLVTLRSQVEAAEPELRQADLRLQLAPIAQGGGVAGTLLLADGSALAFRTTGIASWSLNAGLLLRFSLPSLLLFGLASLLVRSAFKPLNRLVEATRQVGTDDMDTLPEQGQSEVRQLIHAFNRMHERIHQLLSNRTQTLLAIGHDLRTPLARLQLRLDSARIDEAMRTEMSGDIAEMVELLASLRAYVELGREAGPAQRIDLAAMARTQVDEATDRGATASYAGPDRLEMAAHPLGLRRAISNLVQNAIRYGGRADVTLSDLGDRVTIEVVDAGPGIAPDRMAEVLQPFIRLDEARARDTQGMGLGLAIVERAVRAEGGSLTLANRPQGGLAATINLPKRAGEPGAKPRNIS